MRTDIQAQSFRVTVQINARVESAGKPYLTEQRSNTQIERFLSYNHITNGLPCHGDAEMIVTDVIPLPPPTKDIYTTLVQQIKSFQEAVGTAHWNLNYADFCRRLGRSEEDGWSEKMWQMFQQLWETTAAFDCVTLTKIITPEPSAWTAEEILRNEG